MAQGSYQLINLTTDLVLSWPSSFSGGPVVVDRNDINPNQNSWTIALPDATLVSNGQYFIFNNISIYSFQVLANDLLTVLATINAGEIIEIYLYDASTSNGLWRIVPYGGGTNAIVAFTAQSTDSSITITGGNVTPPGGIINFQLPTSLFNLDNVGTIGFPIINTISPLTWTTVDLVAGENILITNPNGVAGDPVINLNPVVTGLSSLEVGDLQLTGSLITTNVVNGDIQLSSSGTGVINLNGITIDANANVRGVNTPRASCTFTDTIVGMSNIIVIQDQSNVTSITGSSGAYTINFATALNSTNYGVFFGLGTTGGSLPFISSAYSVVKELDSVSIYVVDASGELVNSVPNGINVIIMLVS